MKNKRALLILLLGIVLLMAACNGDDGDTVAVAATSTLIPPPGSVADPSATPFITRTPLPSLTPTPTDTPIPSETPLPSETPTPVPIIGIIQSLNTVNVRSGPGITYSAVEVLTPGTGVEVLQSSPEGDWYLVEYETEDGGMEVGWIAAFLLFIQDPPTPIPTFTLTPDLTALALGTGTPIGGGTVTATPPRSVTTATPVGGSGDSGESVAQNVPNTLVIPTLDLNSIDQTATALAGGSVIVATPRPIVTQQPGITVTVAPTSDEAPNTQPTSSGPGEVQEGADIFAMCDNPSFGISPPRNLAAGSTGEVYWAWIAKTRDLINQHVAYVTYEVRINGRLLSNWKNYGQTTQDLGNSFAKYWYVPVGELEAGDYTVTYRASWSQQISDGWAAYGPGTRNPVEEGSCTFSVR